MSHFAFGVVGYHRELARTATNTNFEVCWGAPLQQGVVMEMLALHSLPTAADTPFSLVGIGEDTADSLISPYCVDRNQLGLQICTMLAWLEREAMASGAELWLTEGFNDRFISNEGSRSDLETAVRRLLDDSNDVPSVRLRLARR